MPSSVGSVPRGMSAKRLWMGFYYFRAVGIAVSGSVLEES